MTRLNTPMSLGFTLLELMVALSITAVIGTISATMLNGTIANHTQVQREEKRLTELERALHIMRSDIEQIALRPVIQSIYHANNFVPDINKNQLLGDESSIEFNIYNNYPENTQIVHNLARVRYRLEEQHLIRENINTDFPSPNQQWHKQQLLTQVNSLNFAYFINRWENYLASNKKFPAAIRVTIDTQRWQNIELVVRLSGVDQ